MISASFAAFLIAPSCSGSFANFPCPPNQSKIAFVSHFSLYSLNQPCQTSQDETIPVPSVENYGLVGFFYSFALPMLHDSNNSHLSTQEIPLYSMDSDTRRPESLSYQLGRQLLPRRSLTLCSTMRTRHQTEDRPEGTFPSMDRHPCAEMNGEQLEHNTLASFKKGLVRRKSPSFPYFQPEPHYLFLFEGTKSLYIQDFKYGYAFSLYSAILHLKH